MVATAALPVGRDGHLAGGFKNGGVTVGSDRVAARVVGLLLQLAPKVRKVPCAVLLPAALFIRIERPPSPAVLPAHRRERA